MLIPVEKINEAKAKYDGKAIEEIVKYFDLEGSYNERDKSCSCPWHRDKTPSFIWNEKTNCFHCFAPETEVITKEGVVQIGSIINKPVEIINGNGQWEKVYFRDYGQQKLLKLTLKSNGKNKVIYTTPEHKWIIQGKKHKIETKDLKPGYRCERMWFKNQDTIDLDIEGLRHGFIYGDGHKYRDYYTARICDENKYNFCKKIFDIKNPLEGVLKNLPNCLGIIQYKTDYDAKAVPDIHSTKEYLLGFLAGYFVADGNCSANTVQIHSTKYEDLVKIKHIFTILGIPTYPIGETVRDAGKNMGRFTLAKKSILYALRVVKSTIPDNFYISDKKPQTDSVYKSYLGWTVVSVEETDRFESVYCCETSTQSFVLKDFILTSNCFSCGRNYGIIDLYLEQGMTYLEAVEKLFQQVDIDYNFSQKGVQSAPSYKYPKREKNDRTKTEQYLQARCISVKTMDYADIQSDCNGNIAFHFYDSNDVLLTVKYRLADKFDKEKHKSKCWSQAEASFTPLLFNMNRVDPSKPLVITEGEIDCLSVIEAGYTNVVSIPNGCSNAQWVQHNWDWLEQFHKIILWFDTDEPGIKARNDIIYRLGTWRTYYVEIEPTELTPKGAHIKDINEVLFFKGKERVLEYINKPLEVPVEKVLDLSKAEDFDIENTEGLYTGIKELDDKIYKLTFGTLNIITGKSGEGKSVFVNQVAICQAVQQGYEVFVFSGELPAPILRNWVETNMIGRDFITMRNGHVRVFDPEQRKIMQNWYSGKVLVYDDDYNTTATALLNKMEELARKCGTKVFLIDNLMMIDLECSEEGRLQAEKDFVNKLIFFAKKYNVLVFLVAHPRKTGEIRVTKEDIAGSGNIVNLAHMVFSVHRYTDSEKAGSTNGKGDYIRGKEPIQHESCVEVLKNRITGVLPLVKLYFDYPSYRFYQTPEEVYFRYGWDKRDPKEFPIPTTDPNIHTTGEEVSPL